ncbi:MAG: alpha-glucosidase/alpha-galactosidase [Candidatus Poribacteria bacterium]
MPKIALIGAGSFGFGRRLLADVLSFPELSESHISLMDIDEQKLSLIEALTNKLLRDTGVGATIEVTSDRKSALDGADYVLTTIRVGDDYDLDKGIPLKYGLDQSVADTIGPGGVFKGLRTTPVLLDVCKDMEELCPDALLMNYTNPMAISCWAINRGTNIKNIGLCHSVQGTARQLAGYIGAPVEEISYWVAGINHMSWFLEFHRNGEDAYPALWEKLDDPEIFAKDTVRFEIMRHFGYFVTESTRHMSEYVPYFRKRGDIMEKFSLQPSPPTHPYRWEQREQRYIEMMKEQIDSKEKITLNRTAEYASYIIHAIETGVPRMVNVNVDNTGLVTNLPDGCCVEVPCVVDKTGIHPCYVGGLPPQCAALNIANINMQRMAVKAILEKDRQAAFHAIALDPLTAAVLSLNEIRRMFDEMFAAQTEYLDGF